MRGLLLLLAVVIGAGVAGSAGAGPAQAPARPNVLVVMTDDQTVESLRVMTNVRALLAGEGTTFANSFASFPLCCPSRSTFLTGQYAHNHTVMGNAMPTGGYEKLDHSNTMPVWLQRAGYRTVHIGKYLNGYGSALGDRDPARLDRVVRLGRPLDVPVLQLHAERERRAPCATAPTPPPTRRTSTRGRPSTPCGGSRRAGRSSSTSRTWRRTAAGRARPTIRATSPRPCPRRGTATASRRSRCRSRRHSTRPTSATSLPGSAAGA